MLDNTATAAVATPTEGAAAAFAFGAGAEALPFMPLWLKGHDLPLRHPPGALTKRQGTVLSGLPTAPFPEPLPPPVLDWEEAEGLRERPFPLPLRAERPRGLLLGAGAEAVECANLHSLPREQVPVSRQDQQTGCLPVLPPLG